jgi:hypothetical protein
MNGSRLIFRFVEIGSTRAQILMWVGGEGLTL